MRVDRRQAVLGNERDDLLMIGIVKGVRHHNQTPTRFGRKFSDGCIDLRRVMNWCGGYGYRSRTRKCLKRMYKCRRSRRRVINVCEPSYGRRNLPEQIHPFPENGEFVDLKAGYIASRSCKTLDETAAYRIADITEHNRDGVRLLFKRAPNGSGASDNNFALQPYKLSRSGLHAIWITTVRAIFNLQIVAFNPPEFFKSLFEGIHFGSTYRVDCIKPQHPDPPDLRGLCVRPQKAMPPRRPMLQ